MIEPARDMFARGDDCLLAHASFASQRDLRVATSASLRRFMSALAA
jgi:hypothetical protein